MSQGTARGYFIEPDLVCVSGLNGFVSMPEDQEMYNQEYTVNNLQGVIMYLCRTLFLSLMLY